jgi:glycosyltransferase involved in cell wall biosynthesis
MLVDPERPGELTDAIRRLLDDPDLRQRLGRAAEERARTQFSSRALAERLQTGLGWS